nr:MAG TPA: Putative ATP dependent Clp protease [Caudoviricetes sp.]
MARLKIYGDIVDSEENSFMQMWGIDNGVTFQSIDDFLSSISEDDKTIDIHIHCRGGNVIEGWAIYDALRHSGKEISATIDGECSSMATIVLLSAPKERRKAYTNAHFCIHNPSATMYNLDWSESLTADNIEKGAARLTKQAEQLRAEQDRILDLYVERTGTDRETLQAVMDKDVIYGMDKAIELGFISEVLPPITAKRQTPKTQNNMHNDKEEVQVKRGILDRILAKAGFKALEDVKIVDMVVTAADGSELTIERESGDPQVGDSASPDGSFVMEDGTTIVVSDGVITEIIPPVEAKTEEEFAALEAELEALKAENEQLKADKAALEERISELESQLGESEAKAKNEEESAILAKVKNAGGVAWLDKILSMKSTFHAKNTRTQVRTVETEDESPIQKAKRALEEKIESRKKQ